MKRKRKNEQNRKQIKIQFDFSIDDPMMFISAMSKYTHTETKPK
jgi:hypothetical protein